MDRYDEAKHVHSDDDISETPARQGDILGLGGAAVPKAPGDPVTEYDEASARRRRERASESESVDETPTHGAGATGIDMGSGGTGTDID